MFPLIPALILAADDILKENKDRKEDWQCTVLSWIFWISVVAIFGSAFVLTVCVLLP